MNALDSTQIDTLRMAAAGDQAWFSELFELYLHDAREFLTELTALAGSRDAEAIERTAHKLKGSSSNVGAAPLAELCREIMLACREHRLDGMGEQVTRVRAEFARVEQAIQSLLAMPV